MKPPLGAVVAMLLCAGCRAPTPPADPFLYRSTIPPPGTIVPGAPAPAQPYYPAAPGAIPGPATAPPTISPGTPLAPGVAPIGPSSAPISPAPNKYSPPGGFNPQSSLQARPGVPEMPNGSPGRASGPDDSEIVAANWQTPALNAPANVVATAATTAAPATTPAPAAAAAPAPAAAPPPAPSIVRIVEPAKSSVATSAPVAAPASATPSSAASPAGAAMPASVSLATVTSAPLAQMVARPTSAAAPAITDLPLASGAAASQSQSPTAAAAPVNLPAERPGASYGYDPDYKTLRGKLEYSATSRRWKLIYLPPDGAIDEYGGNAVLPDPSQLEGFEGGDFVTATGTFAPPTAGGGSATFAIQRIKRQ